MQILPKILRDNDDRKRAEAKRRIIQEEARIGGTLFGPLPEGHRREFFCLDRHTWVWHEEWTDSSGQRQVLTTSYNFRPSGVLKSQNNQSSQPVSKDELANLLQAIKLYEAKVVPQLERMLQQG